MLTHTIDDAAVYLLNGMRIFLKPQPEAFIRKYNSLVNLTVTKFKNE